MSLNESQIRKVGGVLGLSSVMMFVVSLIVLGNLNEDFSFVEDFVSKLGTYGAPNAIWWNLLGFVLVGLLIMSFGIVYGVILMDRLTGILLAFFGIGFVFAVIPINLVDASTTASKAHVLAVCLALAFWLCGLSRISYNQLAERKYRFRANVAAMAIVLAITGFVFGLWSMPITHRLVFGVVFGWTGVSAINLFQKVDIGSQESLG
jgi:hypothetical protein